MGNNDELIKIRRNFYLAGILMLIFIFFTMSLLYIDVEPIGPGQSLVGLATLNRYMSNVFGTNLFWYGFTDMLGIIAIGTAGGFSMVGLVQLIQRKSLKRIDSGIILLGIFYVVVMACYFLFEMIHINYRPIIMEDELEVSFPSSHTMIVLFIMASSIIQFGILIKNRTIRTVANFLASSVIVLTVVGRMISGIHWFTDIIGGILVGSALVHLYYTIIQSLHFHQNPIQK
ncbi:MAG: phosphoesterase PA-phosphatase [Sphingobacterium sp.]|jgi:undecaprenyl-diphosphatase|nr:phosphoesterase PA-phosphatase [Sphingobacterium sp.]